MLALKLGMDEIKNGIQKKQIKIVWTCDEDDRREDRTCDEDDRREDSYENATHKNGAKMSRGRTRMIRLY